MNYYSRKRISTLLILLAAPLLMAALWMDEQPSYKAYEAPLPAPPVNSVPVSGKELVSQESEPKNPVAPTEITLARGKVLFDINCALCHGSSPVERGRVGKKLSPPAPGLDPETMRSRSDSHIFKAVSLGFGRMPPFRDKLSPEERWHLVNYLRTRK